MSSILVQEGLDSHDNNYLDDFPQDGVPDEMQMSTESENMNKVEKNDNAHSIEEVGEANEIVFLNQSNSLPADPAPDQGEVMQPVASQDDAEKPHDSDEAPRQYPLSRSKKQTNLAPQKTTSKAVRPTSTQNTAKKPVASKEASHPHPLARSKKQTNLAPGKITKS
ncbi:unnamed protein product [Phytomonas sp. EM1]|nr:unnamed protein product [Phytomonas sp. EM1]|eukprot:CCW62841.1 unnamed protein product [Phytomonas sp. isolate EM1]